MNNNSHSKSTEPWTENENETGTDQMGKQGDSSSKSLHPMEMEHIVEKVLGHLDVTSLKSARQVNKLWSFEGVKILLKNVWISLPRDFHSSKNQEELKEEFKTFLSSNSFKIPHMSINNPKDVAVFKSLKALKEEAKEVKSLRWRDLQGEGDSGDVLKGLLHCLPNFNYLDIDDDDDDELEKVVLNFCNNRKNQKDLTISNVSLRAEPETIEEIEEFGVIKELQQFSECERVRIENLQVSCMWVLTSHPQLQDWFVSVLNTLLRRNKNNLKGFTFCSSQRCLSKLQIPQLTALQNLCLTFEGEEEEVVLDCDYSFPPGFKFARATPKLKEFSLTWDGEPSERLQDDIWTIIFESTGPAPSVKELVYFENSAGYEIDTLFHVFPNLEDVHCYSVGDFEGAAVAIWKYGLNIKNLELEFILDEQTTQLSSFDRILTGFSQATVEKIKNSREDRATEDLEILRENPSILDLKELESLRLSFSGGPCSKYFPRRILTVAADYAFQLMPNVKIKIDVKECTPNPKAALAALKKVSQLPNVEIEVE